MIKFDDNGIYHGIGLDCRMKSLSCKEFDTAIYNRVGVRVFFNLLILNKINGAIDGLFDFINGIFHGISQALKWSRSDAMDRARSHAWDRGMLRRASTSMEQQAV